MLGPVSYRLRLASMLALFFIAFAVGIEVLRPFITGAVGFDTAASVIHFDRIVAGRHLETFVTATPKPLLTLLDGGLMAILDDWRAVALAAVAAFAGSVVFGAWFAGRLGGFAAGTFAAIALLGSRSLLADVSLAYAIPFALLLWLVAGLAVTATPGRPLLAGLALAGATLVRVETIVIVFVAAAALLVLALIGRRRGAPVDRSWWLILVGLIAIPIMLVHDLLLTGDPLFWTTVATVFSEAAPDAVDSPLEILTEIINRYAGLPIMAALAGVGLGWLAWRRAVAPLAGLAALSVGVAALLVLLAVRGTYVSLRYYAAIDLALLVAAAIGWGALVRWVAGWLDRRPDGAAGAATRPLVRGALVAAFSAVVAAAAVWPIASLDASFRSSARSQRLQAEHEVRVLPVVRCALAAVPGTGVFPSANVALAPADPAEVRLLVPTLLRPRFARDLDLPLDQVGGTPVTWLDPNGQFLPHGALVFHDRRGDRGEAFAILEVDRPTTIGDVTLIPLVADPAAGIWLDWIGRAEGPSPPVGCAEAAD